MGLRCLRLHRGHGHLMGLDSFLKLVSYDSSQGIGCCEVILFTDADRLIQGLHALEGYGKLPVSRIPLQCGEG